MCENARERYCFLERCLISVAQMDFTVSITMAVWSRPFFGLTLTSLCVTSYYTTFRESVVRMRWCRNEEECSWMWLHDLIVPFFAVNIFLNYLRCCFESPGFVVENSEIQNMNDVRDDYTFGGCCCLTSRMNLAREHARCAEAFKEHAEIEKQLQDASTDGVDIVYYPSPETTICKKSGVTRPARAHYCSVLKKNVLEYDHHCPWVNNCIGKYNYRYFFRLLSSLIGGCLYGVGLLGAEFCRAMRRHFLTYGFRPLGARYSTGLLDLPPPWVLLDQYRSNGKVDDEDILRMAFPLLAGVGLVLSLIILPHLRLGGLTTVERLGRRDIVGPVVNPYRPRK